MILNGRKTPFFMAKLWTFLIGQFYVTCADSSNSKLSDNFNKIVIDVIMLPFLLLLASANHASPCTSCVILSLLNRTPHWFCFKTRIPDERWQICNIKRSWHIIMTWQLNLVSIVVDFLQNTKMTINPWPELDKASFGKPLLLQMNPHNIIFTINTSFAMFISTVNILIIMFLNPHANPLVRSFNLLEFSSSLILNWSTIVIWVKSNRVTEFLPYTISKGLLVVKVINHHHDQILMSLNTRHT